MDDRFFWNKHMLSDIIQIGNDYSRAWVNPIIQGYVEIAPIYKLDLSLILISRRSRFRAGTRYKRRGLNPEGHCANYVETEQIISYKSHAVSFVQVRGSVPLFWSQPGIKYRPAPILHRNFAENQQAFEKHFEEQLSLYDKVIIVNLVEHMGKESIIYNAYTQHVLSLNNEQLVYVSFDFHEYCRGMHFERVSLLTDKLKQESIFQDMGYSWKDKQGLICQQKAIFRVNCIDCLDRTNVVQTALAKTVLIKQLKKLGIVSPEGKIWLYRIAIFCVNRTESHISHQLYRLSRPNQCRTDSSNFAENQQAFEKHFEEQLSLYDKVIIVNLVEQMGKESIIYNAYTQHVLSLNNEQLVYVNFAENQQAFEKHFEEQLSLYDKVIIVNLVEHMGKESIIYNAYTQHVLSLNNEQLVYVSFDFHEYCRGEIENTDGAISDDEDDDDVDNSEEEDPNAVLHIKTLIEDCKRLMLTDQEHVINAWPLIAWEEQGSGGKEAVESYIPNIGIIRSNVSIEATEELDLNDILIDENLSMGEIENTDGAISDDEDDDDVDNSEEEDPNAVLHIKTLIEDCKRLMLTDQEHVINAWPLIAWEEQGSGGGEDFDRILILTKDMLKIAEYNVHLDSMKLMVCVPLKTIVGLYLGKLMNIYTAEIAVICKLITTRMSKLAKTAVTMSISSLTAVTLSTTNVPSSITRQADEHIHDRNSGYVQTNNNKNVQIAEDGSHNVNILPDSSNTIKSNPGTSTSEIENTDGAISDDEDDDDVDNSEEEDPNAVLHIKTLIEDCKRLMLTDQEHVINAWPLIAWEEQGSGGGEDFDRILILTKDMLKIAEYNVHLDSMKLMVCVPLKTIVGLYLGPLNKSTTNTPVNSPNTALHTKSKRLYMKLVLRGNNSEVKDLILTSSRIHYFNNQVSLMRSIDEKNESLRAVVESIQICMRLSKCFDEKSDSRLLLNIQGNSSTVKNGEADSCENGKVLSDSSAVKNSEGHMNLHLGKTADGNNADSSNVDCSKTDSNAADSSKTDSTNADSIAANKVDEVSSIDNDVRLGGAPSSEFNNYMSASRNSTDCRISEEEKGRSGKSSKDFEEYDGRNRSCEGNSEEFYRDNSRDYVGSTKSSKGNSQEYDGSTNSSKDYSHEHGSSENASTKASKDNTEKYGERHMSFKDSQNTKSSPNPSDDSGAKDIYQQGSHNSAPQRNFQSSQIDSNNGGVSADNSSSIGGVADSISGVANSSVSGGADSNNSIGGSGSAKSSVILKLNSCDLQDPLAADVRKPLTLDLISETYFPPGGNFSQGGETFSQGGGTFSPKSQNKSNENLSTLRTSPETACKIVKSSSEKDLLLTNTIKTSQSDNTSLRQNIKTAIVSPTNALSKFVTKGVQNLNSLDPRRRLSMNVQRVPTTPSGAGVSGQENREKLEEKWRKYGCKSKLIAL
ncbi:uncharacterized protein LOC113470240 [Diaphorina citri]|uniref:Uncharacterized protein LOC113470240 n=1 Tax=Diaphorina citri TaxID=121845 RepID=A0A3Q0J796_DIACI|nr:uncharacterized protein LOC113470240 [Diaphorina citri]